MLTDSCYSRQLLQTNSGSPVPQTAAAPGATQPLYSPAAEMPPKLQKRVPQGRLSRRQRQSPRLAPDGRYSPPGRHRTSPSSARQTGRHREQRRTQRAALGRQRRPPRAAETVSTRPPGHLSTRGRPRTRVDTGWKRKPPQSTAANSSRSAGKKLDTAVDRTTSSRRQRVHGDGVSSNRGILGVPIVSATPRSRKPSHEKAGSRRVMPPGTI